MPDFISGLDESQTIFQRFALQGASISFSRGANPAIQRLSVQPCRTFAAILNLSLREDVVNLVPPFDVRADKRDALHRWARLESKSAATEFDLIQRAKQRHHKLAVLPSAAIAIHLALALLHAVWQITSR